MLDFATRKAGLKPYGVGKYGSAFSPMDLTSLYAWYRSDRGITKDGSNRVSKWNDLSGNAHHVVQTGDANKQPLWTANGIQFDSGDQLVNGEVSAHSNTNGLTAFAVINLTDAGGTVRSIISKYLTTDDKREWMLAASWARVMEDGTFDVNYSADIAAGAATGLQLLELHWTPGDKVKIYKDSSLEDSSDNAITDAENTNADLTIGLQDGGGDAAVGVYKEIIVVSEDVSGFDLTKTRNYLTNMYGL